MLTANKGYSSSSAMKEASDRFSRESEFGKEVHVIYLGDHDPSGIDMTRDIEERFALFTREEFNVNVHRLALNFNQVQEWNPPENPAKETDSRHAGYVERFGDSSWELDAVEPATLVELVTNQVQSLIDYVVWDDDEERESNMRSELKKYADDYEQKNQ